jgi:hypothetical protein
MKINDKEIHWKPEFGNPWHAKISAILGRIDKTQKRLLEKGRKDLTNLRSQLKRDKRELLEAMKLERKMR